MYTLICLDEIVIGFIVYKSLDHIYFNISD